MAATAPMRQLQGTSQSPYIRDLRIDRPLSLRTAQYRTDFKPDLVRTLAPGIDPVNANDLIPAQSVGIDRKPVPIQPELRHVQKLGIRWRVGTLLRRCRLRAWQRLCHLDGLTSRNSKKRTGNE